MPHRWASPSRLSVIVMRQLSPTHPEVPTAAVEVPANLVSAEADYPFKVVEAVKEKFCEKLVEFRSARWWFVTAPTMDMSYDGPLISK